MKLTQENVKRKTRIKQLERKKKQKMLVTQFHFHHITKNPQQDPLNQHDQQGQHSYSVRPSNLFNIYQGNQGNPDRLNVHMDINFHRNQNQARISQQVH